tara:strand:- start:226 stop:552 length:327 start_codon:yes stop_codon:yes gene_type:complete
MKIKNKTLNVTFEHDVTVGNAIEATLEHQAWIGMHKDEINVDLDFADITNIKFMGVPIEEGYDAYKKFKSTMLDLGIDLNKLFAEKATELITDENIETLKQLYRNTVK